MDQYFESLGEFQTWMRVVLVLVTAPFWFPALRTIWGEIQEALAEDGGFLGRSEGRRASRRPPELDPFLNVPHEERGRSTGPPRRRS